MPHSFEGTSLWLRTLAPQPGNDPHAEARAALRAAYLQFRSTVEPLAAEIVRSMPMFTDHSIVHIDGLWDTASLVCGDAMPLNPAEGFVLGGAFLLHDLGMGLASYRDEVAAFEGTDEFKDLLRIIEDQLRETEPFADPARIAATAKDQAVVEFLRFEHAAQAERLIIEQFRTSRGESFYLLQDTVLRENFGHLIGRIAHSHWWDVSKLEELKQPQGACVGHPQEWEVDPLKIACILRLADAVQIDQRRAPTFVHAFRKPSGVSGDHWRFQERLPQPRVVGDRLQYTATRPFRTDEDAAWWLAYETIRVIDAELRAVDALCADLGRPRFVVRSVAGADSPARLARFIHTKWTPVDAGLRVTQVRQLVSSLGGKDLYGDRPEVAMRELISNAADALRARRALEDGGQVGPVTVKLSEEDGDWYLTISDQGIGMDPDIMVAALTDFGCSHWRDRSVLKKHPGLLSKGFKPTGKFGIGFFAVFMVADEVQVRSLSYGEAMASTHVLEFYQGLVARPLLRQAKPREQLRHFGTVVRAKLRQDPRSWTGILRTISKTGSTETLHSRLTQMCALLDVDLDAQGPDDANPVRLIQAGDWTQISAAELFRRVYQDREHKFFETNEKAFVKRAQLLRNSDGEPVGRAMICAGSDVFLDIGDIGAPMYVGGMEAGAFDGFVGVFAGKPLKADRLTAFPVIHLDTLQSWIERQAERIPEPLRMPWFSRKMVSEHMRELGAEVPQLLCAECTEGPMDRAGLIRWARDQKSIFLAIHPELIGFHLSGQAPLYADFETGCPIMLPGNMLLVEATNWEIPEEIAQEPKDERFAGETHPESGWNSRAWWYDGGSFGTTGLVIRTIAEAWDIDIFQAVDLIEDLDLEKDADNRVELQRADGGMIKVSAFRMRRPAK